VAQGVKIEGVHLYSEAMESTPMNGETDAVWGFFLFLMSCSPSALLVSWQTSRSACQGYHEVFTSNICVNRMHRWLKKNLGKYGGAQSMGLLSVAYVSWHEYFCMQLITVYDPSLLAAPCLMYQSTINYCIKFFVHMWVYCFLLCSFFYHHMFLRWVLHSENVLSHLICANETWLIVINAELC